MANVTEWEEVAPGVKVRGSRYNSGWTLWHGQVRGKGFSFYTQLEYEESHNAHAAAKRQALALLKGDSHDDS